MDILEQLNYVRELAKLQEVYIREERNLDSKIQPLKPIQQIQAVEVPVTEKYRGWAIFGACEVVITLVINNVLNFILSYFANGGMTYEQSLEAGYISYRNITVFFGVGALLALPLAWIVAKLISGLLKKYDNSETARAQRANADMAERNRIAEEENKNIAQINSIYEKGIADIRKQRQELLKKLEELDIPYEPAYLSVETVDYVTEQIRSGNARTLDEAFSQYEMSRHR